MKISKNRLGFWQGYFNRKAAASGRTTHKMTASGYFKQKYDTPVYRKHTRIW